MNKLFIFCLIASILIIIGTVVYVSSGPGEGVVRPDPIQVIPPLPPPHELSAQEKALARYW